MDCECDSVQKDKFLKELRDMTLSVRVMARTPTEDEGEREGEREERERGRKKRVVYMFMERDMIVMYCFSSVVSTSYSRIGQVCESSVVIWCRA